MLSNQILHKAVQDMKRITGFDCAVWDMQGMCLVMTNEKMLTFDKRVSDFMIFAEKEQKRIEADAAYFLVFDEDEPAYVLVMNGNSTNIEIYGEMIVSQLTNLLFAYKEKMDRSRFVQNLLLDNMLLVDVYNQARKMKIPIEHRRCVFIIEPKQESDNLVLETLRGLFATGSGDFVTAVDEHQIILVKAFEQTEGYADVTQVAKTIVDTLNMEAMVSVRVAYGNIVEELKDVSKSYKEAAMALDVGKVFYVERNILAYSELGIGRLIHQLPFSLCDMFLKEVFDGDIQGLFDDEELTTVFSFFENNLNISETARQLYVHRNTLVYRLEKIQKKTGLDVRKFDDALTFKIAIMVADHMKYMRA